MPENATLEIMRPAVPSDLDQIYLMGLDVWGEGDSETDYLDTCRSSSKYKQGTWYVLERNSVLLSSLIVYPLGPARFGIGSIATPKAFRRKGYASCLISRVIAELVQRQSAATLFLYSDISPEFYERFGFKKLPPELQRYKTTVCMVRGSEGEGLTVPEYF